MLQKIACTTKETTKVNSVIERVQKLEKRKETWRTAFIKQTSKLRSFWNIPI